MTPDTNALATPNPKVEGPNQGRIPYPGLFIEAEPTLENNADENDRLQTPASNRREPGHGKFVDSEDSNSLYEDPEDSSEASDSGDEVVKPSPKVPSTTAVAKQHRPDSLETHEVSRNQSDALTRLFCAAPVIAEYAIAVEPSGSTSRHIADSPSAGAQLTSEQRRRGSVRTSNPVDISCSSVNENQARRRTAEEEEDIHDVERFLASEEGKKLSSKERRRLRNRVSAKAHRSRRRGMCYPQRLGIL